MANEYATLEELKDARRIPAEDTQDDTALQRHLTSASRAIDQRCGRTNGFYQWESASAREYYAAERTFNHTQGTGLLVDDISTQTGLIVEVGDGTSYSPYTHFRFLPENAIARNRAIESIIMSSGIGHGGIIRVTARWGWPAVPESIHEATLLLANRRFMRRDSPEGVAGWSQDGPVRVSRFDPDIEDLISDFVKPGFA